MFTLHWFYSTPETRDSGDMPLKATTLEEAQAEASRLAKQWGWTKPGKKPFIGDLWLYAQGKRRAYWSTLEHVWSDLEG